MQGELGVVADVAIFVVKGLSQRRDRGGGGVADFGEGEGGVAAGGLVVVVEDGGQGSDGLAFFWGQRAQGFGGVAADPGVFVAQGKGQGGSGLTGFEAEVAEDVGGGGAQGPLGVGECVDQGRDGRGSVSGQGVGGVEVGGIAALDIGRVAGLVGFRSGERLRAQGVDKRRDGARAEVAEGVSGVEARGFGGGLQRGEQCTLVERLRCGAFCGCAREPTPDVGRERGMRVVFDVLPVAAAAGSAGLERFLHAQKLEFEHIARPVADIGGGAVPDIEVDQGDGAGGAAEFDLLFGRLGRIGIRDVVVKLAVAGQAGRAHIGVDVLRIVEGHDPAEAVVADVVVEDEIVLVPGLPL